jgi:hypothetical protein
MSDSGLCPHPEHPSDRREGAVGAADDHVLRRNPIIKKVIELAVRIRPLSSSCTTVIGSFAIKIALRIDRHHSKQLDNRILEVIS